MRNLSWPLMLAACFVSPHAAANQPDQPARLNLASALQKAAQHHPDLRNAQYELQARHGAMRQAGAVPNPVLSASMEDTRADHRSSTLQLTQVLEAGGKRAARVALAGAQRDLAGAELAIRRAEVRANVILHFHELLLAQERERLARASLQLAQQALDAARQRVALGKISPIEASRAQVFESAVRQELAQAAQELRNARQQLLSNWGEVAEVAAADFATADFATAKGPTAAVEAAEISTAAVAKAEISTADFPAAGRVAADLAPGANTALRGPVTAPAHAPPATSGMLAEGDPASLPPLPDWSQLLALLPQSPYLLRARLQLEQQNRQVQVVRSNRTSDVSISLGVKRDAQLARNQAVLGIGFALPLFDRAEGQMQEALTRQEQARDEAATSEQRLRAELQQAWQSLALARQAANQSAQELLPAAESTLAATSKGFDYGKFSFLDVLEAQRTLLQAKSQILRNWHEAHRAATGLERLLGASGLHLYRTGE